MLLLVSSGEHQPVQRCRCRGPAPSPARRCAPWSGRAALAGAECDAGRWHTRRPPQTRACRRRRRGRPEAGQRRRSRQAPGRRCASRGPAQRHLRAVNKASTNSARAAVPSSPSRTLMAGHLRASGSDHQPILAAAARLKRLEPARGEDRNRRQELCQRWRPTFGRSGTMRPSTAGRSP